MKLIGLSVVFALAAVASDANASGSECRMACKSVPAAEDVHVVFGGQGGDALSAQQLNIAVWNIYKSKKETWAQDFSAVARNSDILLIQEVKLDEAALQIYDSQPDLTWDMATSFFLKDAVRTGVALGSRAIPTLSEAFVSFGTEPVVNSPKTMMAAIYNWQGANAELLVLTIHALHGHGPQGVVRQVEQLASTIEAHDGPVILGGDFNTHTVAHRQLLDNRLEEMGLKKVVWPNDTRSLKIDHVYYRDVNVVEPQLHQDVPGSDHPLLTLSIEPM